METPKQTEERHNKLDACWKGEKCVICQFALDQREFNEIVETESGYAHSDCLDERDNKNEDSNLEREQ